MSRALDLERVPQKLTLKLDPNPFHRPPFSTFHFYRQFWPVFLFKLKFYGRFLFGEKFKEEKSFLFTIDKRIFKGKMKAFLTFKFKYLSFIKNSIEKKIKKNNHNFILQFNSILQFNLILL